MIDRRLQTRAGDPGALEGVAHQLVQQRRERDLRIGADRIAKRERAVRGQLGDEPFGQRFDDIFLFILLRFGRLAADGDDGALDAACDPCVCPVRIACATDLMTLRVDRCLVLRPNITATDDKLAGAINADEHAGARDLDGIVNDRALLERLEHLFDLAQALVDLVGQFIGFRIFRFDPVILLAQRLAGGTFVVGEIDGGARSGHEDPDRGRKADRCRR